MPKTSAQVIRDDAKIAAKVRENFEHYGYDIDAAAEKGEVLRLLPGCKPEHAVTTEGYNSDA